MAIGSLVPDDSQPSVSVVIPCFNGEAFIAETIDSVLAQTVGAKEVIVVDDGSTDATQSVLKSYASKVKVIRQANQGESVARNRGIEEASGRWIAFLDADDLWHSTKLEKQLQAAQSSSETVCVHTGIYVFGAINMEPANDPAVGADDYSAETLICRPSVHISSTLVRAEACPRFPEWTQYGEDMMFLAELSLRGDFAFVEERLTGYRRHSGAQSFRGEPDRLVKHFQSRFEWVTRFAPVSEERREQLIEALVADIVTTTDRLRYCRQWDHYWTLRRFLSTHPVANRGAIPRLANERIWPRLCYAAKDTVDSWRDRLVTRLRRN